MMEITNEMIAEKLKQVPQYRKREQEQRNAVADYIYAKGI
jgi:hypothetical protein